MENGSFEIFDELLNLITQHKTKNVNTLKKLKWSKSRQFYLFTNKFLIFQDIIKK